jgi:tetratricopeptide (TPR) repeat protein
MSRFKTCLLLLGLSLSVLTISAHRQSEQAKPDARENAYRANNIGVALLEQFKHKEAADAFRRALQLQPDLALARINLGIALFNVPDLPAAQKELQAASALAPSAPQPPYLLGLLAKTQNRPEEAIAAFQKVLRVDANDVGANINLGQLYAQQRKYTEAIAVLRTAIAAEPYNATALYNLGTALMRGGQREEGQKVIAQFQELRQRGTGTTLGTNYLEQGRYAEAIASTGAEADLVDKRTPEVVFTDVTATVLPAGDWPAEQESGGAVLLFDYDLDGDLDLLEVSGTRQRLARNDAGKFTDVTARSGELSSGALSKASSAGVAAIAGDYDNDNRHDLFVVRAGASTLYHNDGNGSFSDVTAASKIPAVPFAAKSTAFADVDHDGDLDIVIAGEGHLLLRNNGDRTFSDQSAAAKLADKVAARAIVPTDFDNRRDIDLLIASTEKISLWRNMRDGTFRDVATDVGLTTKGATAVAAGDINKDSFTDFYFSSGATGSFAMSNGKERFQITQAPAGSDASQLLDYDNDGLLDLISIAQTGVRVLRNTGDSWTDVSDTATKNLAAGTGTLVLASGDLDADGDTDLVFGVPGGGLKVARNDGGNANRSLRVGLAGKVSNRSAVGSKIEMRAGSLAQKLETYAAAPAPAPADVIFGLGKRTTVDAVRVLWPAGILQAETEFASPGKSLVTLSLTELDRKPSSCPYLYVWNGEQFEFVTDFMGGGEMGHLDAPGIYNTPDPDEYVRIRSDQLRERDGRYELRITNELEEALFVDHVQLISVAHPQGMEVYPNEGLTVPPRPFKLFTTQSARVPLAAVDEHGHDVLPRIARMDREYPDDFGVQPIRGYAEEHELILKLDPDLRGRALLLMTGWTDYAWSSDNLAASQSGKSLRLPALQVKDERGQWKTVIENVGIPVGRPQTVVADLTGKFLSASREVRIVTNMRIYWDQILVDDSPGNFPVQLTRLDPLVADLRWRGFSLEYAPEGRQPMSYDYKKVSFTSPWKVMTGRYTREGDVRELLLESDDMFVISRPGDELILSFAADKLPPLPKSWTRTFLLYGDGFSKEMDINSASPDHVGPLPQRYPMTEKRLRYMENYNTRVVTSPIPDRISGLTRFTRLSGVSE